VTGKNLTKRGFILIHTIIIIYWLKGRRGHKEYNKYNNKSLLEVQIKRKK